MQSTLLGIILASLAGTAVIAGAGTNPPDPYLCYQAGHAKHQPPSVAGLHVGLQDSLGGPQRFAVRKFAHVCNPVGRDGTSIAHDTVHLERLTIKAVKGAPKFVTSTRVVTDPFATRTLAVGLPTSFLDVTPVQRGNNAPAYFGDDPTTSAVELNRFKCYGAKLPKGAPKFMPPPPPTLTDDVFPHGQRFVVEKLRELCLPADADGATPGAASRATLLVCYAVALKGAAAFVKPTVGTHGRIAGVRVVVQKSPVELCVPGHAGQIRASPSE